MKLDSTCCHCRRVLAVRILRNKDTKGVEHHLEQKAMHGNSALLPTKARGIKAVAKERTTLGRPVNARFIKRFSHRHSVCLCIFYHVYEGFVVLVLGGVSTPFFHGSQALSFSI